MDSARQGVWVYDISTGYKYYSDIWREIRGLRPGQPEPQTDEDWLKVIHPEDRVLASDQTRRLNAGELAEVNYEYRERHVDGHWIWIMCRGRAVAWDAAGKPYRFVGTDTDISAIKASEDRVTSMSRRLELALSSVEIGVFTFDIQRETIEWDARLCQIYGLPPDLAPLPRRVWEDRLHPDDAEEACRITYGSVELRRDYGLEYRIIRPDGAVRFIRSRVSYQDDKIAGPRLVGINWDATEEYEASKALREANALAEKRNQELEAARAEMEHNALHDALTGLPNRRKLDKVQQDYAASIVGSMARVAVLQIDLDRFKQINDVYGHDVGDFVLCRIADILREGVLPSSVVARVGGDEFAVFVPDAPEARALGVLAEALIARAAQPIHYAGLDIRCGISVGIALYEGFALDGRDLFINADLALYRAKADGRGRARFFNAQMRHAFFAQKQLADEILGGLERDEFQCVYQPQFDARSGEISGVEALVRWNSARRRLLLPSEFLDAADEINVLARIDHIVLRKAVEEFGRWRAAGLSVPRLSVNLSKARLRDPDLPAELAALDIDPAHLSLELLESNYLDDQGEVVAANLAAIRALGIGIEVDDFGTGHASIVSLLRLKPARLKIDRALVGPIAVSQMQAQLVRSIVEIGHLQGISIIAEGVETEEQKTLLQSMHCDELQGFLLARPMPAAEVAAFMQQMPAPWANRPRRKVARLR